MKKTNIRWKPWAIVAGLVAAYSTAGFWLVPTVLKQQIPKLGESMLARQASVGDVSFNPYTLRLEMQGLRLAEADGAPLVAVGELAVELQWRTLVRRAWSFAEIRITEPEVHPRIAADGKFNFATLAESLKSEEESDEAGLPRLIVERFLLERGKVEMLDQQAGYENRFYPIDLALNNFSTLPDRKGTHTFHADFPSGGRLSWEGESSVNPIGGSGTLSLTDGSLPELAPYLKPYTDATVAAGKFEARLPYRFSYQDGRLAASLSGARLALHTLSVHAAGGAAATPLKAGADKLQFDFGLTMEQAGEDLQLRLANAAFTATGMALENGKHTPFKLAQLGFAGGALDLAARRAHVDRLHAEDGQLELKRNGKGQIEILDLLNRFAAASRKTQASPETPVPSEASPWTARIDRVEASRVGAAIADEATGIKAHVQDIGLQLDGVSTDLKQPVKFNAGLGLQEGGQFSAQGELVPGSSAVKADVHVKQLALSPLQPLLGQYVKLKIAGGKLSAQGQLAVNAGGDSGTSLRYEGGFDIAGFALDEEDGERFASWKSVGADKLIASLGPDRLEIPELRIVEPNATLIINEDGTFNAARLLVKPASSGAQKKSPPPSQAQSQTDEAFPVRIRRLRFQNAKLDFSDLSLLPQFGAKIYELNGVVTGLSSRRTSRSQIELDGRVDEFGLARIRGGLNVFAPRNNTDIKVAFKNIDLVSASPYSMKFAGYRIAEGKISLDLGYKVRDGQLEGDNQIVIDNLTLGERIDSPDALKLPLELAIAILKDSNGRIDLGLPVYGDMNDPQFSYGAIIWKAIGNVLTKIVTAPFRALAGMFGSGENIEAIEFDPGSDRLLPPEREKLKQVAQILAKRAQLKLTVPGHYSEEADGAALKRDALRTAIAKRAGIRVVAEERVGPLDLRARSVRSAVRALYAERFGEAELEKQKAAAEAAAAVAEDGKAASASEKLSVWQRAGNLMSGEPQVADTGEFYRSLLERLQQSQPLADDALARLGTQRANVILAALKEAGVDTASAVAAAPEQVSADAGKPVALKLGLSAK